MSSPVTTIVEVGKHEGQAVTVRGWLYNLRESGKLLFPQFRDGSGVIQGVVPKNAVPPEVFDAIKGLTLDSCVSPLMASKTSGGTAFFGTTPWMTPEPSRNCGKRSLPLSRRL